MSGTRYGLGRIVALGVLLALSMLLLAASKADAGRYAVAQCGWYAGADAGWADTTGGLKFRSDAYCVPPAGADPFAGAHLKSFTRDGQGTVSGTRFARWRWTAPPGTGITQVRGTWWQALHDGIEQRLGGVDGAGGFEPFATASATDTAPREFTKGFPAPVAAFEDRLLCARAETKWCSLEPGSWSALRALTLTVEDPNPPTAVYVFGELLNPGWHRGVESVHVADYDVGGGVRYAETKLDGIRVALTEFPCAKASIGGQWRATRMQPCPTGITTVHSVATAAFADGPHNLVTCAIDFADNGNCAAPRGILVDNNAPAHPRAVSLAGGEGWRRLNDFDLSWENPDQGQGSPLGGASWRIAGPGGFDTGVRVAPGRDRKSLLNLSVPASGAYALRLWLRDEAGNEAPSSAVTAPLRFDDLSPAVGFSAEAPETQVKAEVTDAHSGPASGQLLYRRVDAQEWIELPTKLMRGESADRAQLVAPMPELGFGTFVFRADAADAAGNAASTTLRTDGTQMAVRKVPPPHVPKAKSRLFAWLRGGDGRGDSLAVRFGAPALLSGRLTRADSAGVGGRELRVVSRPSRGALAPLTVETIRTGEQGGFELPLPLGPSRRVTVSFLGDGGLEPASRLPLELRVRAGISLRAVPQSLRTGQVVRLSGRVRSKGAPLPRRGKLVAIQYLEEATDRWRPVLVTRSDHHGRYRARYRFRYVTGSAAIRLRATALAEERWPYVPGSSPPVTIRVQGS
ncbi:MAG TPA: hypothetical protein VLI94_12995 [Solirubrobacterales bacterium]|nr:hypothetical protein [Solirubrobacterales bacterium]